MNTCSSGHHDIPDAQGQNPGGIGGTGAELLRVEEEAYPSGMKGSGWRERMQREGKDPGIGALGLASGLGHGG